MVTTVSAAILPHAAPDLGQRAGARVTPIRTANAGVAPAGAASDNALEPGELAPEGAGGGQRAEDGLSADVSAGRFATALHDFAANRDAAHHLSVGERESLGVDKWLTKCKIDKPDRFSGESAGCGEHVKSFLSEVKRYFAVTGLPVSSWGVMSAHFLKGAALLSWELEFQDAVLAEGSSAVSWDQFEHFMLDSFGLFQPATEIRSAYDAMLQSDYDTVSEFVREFRLKERELIGTPYHPGGSAIIDFIKKLTPAVRKYVQDNAPEEWWTDVKQVHKKSLQYELNQRAAVTVHVDSDYEPDVGLETASESEHDDDDLLEHDTEQGGRKRVRTPPSVWDARKKSQTCYRCGKPGHRAKDCSAEF